MKIIRVKKVGEMPEYYRTYYKGVDTGRYYCKTEFRGEITWDSTSENYGEPDCPIRKDIEFVEAEQ